MTKRAERYVFPYLEKKKSDLLAVTKVAVILATPRFALF